MVIVAISTKGREFLFKANTAHKVPKTSAQKIADLLNSIKYQLKDGETWHVHEIDRYSNSYAFALTQDFYIYGGNLKEKRY